MKASCSSWDKRGRFFSGAPPSNRRWTMLRRINLNFLPGNSNGISGQRPVYRRPL